MRVPIVAVGYVAHFEPMKNEIVGSPRFRQVAPQVRKEGFTASTMANALSLLQHLITEAHRQDADLQVINTEYFFVAPAALKIR